MVMRFPAKINAGCPGKDGILCPRRVALALPSPSQRLCGRTDGHVTITSQPKFLGLIGYQFSLAMELRWRALPAGSATNNHRYWNASVYLCVTNLCSLLYYINMHNLVLIYRKPCHFFLYFNTGFRFEH